MRAPFRYRAGMAKTVSLHGPGLPLEGLPLDIGDDSDGDAQSFLTARLHAVSLVGGGTVSYRGGDASPFSVVVRDTPAPSVPRSIR